MELCPAQMQVNSKGYQASMLQAKFWPHAMPLEQKMMRHCFIMYQFFFQGYQQEIQPNVEKAENNLTSVLGITRYENQTFSLVSREI